MKALRIVLMVLVALAAGALASSHAQMPLPILFTLEHPSLEAHTGFGGAAAIGDTNGDGKADIAVGASGEEVGGNEYQGRAYVFSSADGSLLLTLDTPNPQEGAYFSWEAVAVGDVNGDGKADIAVGAMGEDVSANEDQGRAYVFSGLDGSLLCTLDTPNPQEYAHFGYAVAVGDVDDNGKADIAVGAYGYAVGGSQLQGRVYVFSGLDCSLLCTLDTPNPQTQSYLGVSVAVGEVDGDGKGDIAVGAMGEEVDGNEHAGRTYVFSGADCSLGACSVLHTLESANPQAPAWFGESVAVGDANGDDKADIAVGTRKEDVDGTDSQGRVYVFSGLNGSLLFTLDKPYPPQAGVWFGCSVAMGDVDGDDKADVATYAPHEDVGGNEDQGRAYIFSGADGSPFLTLDAPNPQACDPYPCRFGQPLALGDVNDDGKADIAVSAGAERVSGDVQGRVYVFSGAPPVGGI
ncbi:MAG: hypothetical protein AMJ77_01990, partial [Dehalococcoidia bacterium SM23_28_2]